MNAEGLTNRDFLWRLVICNSDTLKYYLGGVEI